MTTTERSRALAELREIRLRVVENRLILQAIVRSMERAAQATKRPEGSA